MKYHLTISVSFLLLLSAGVLTAQDEPFKGGIGDGFAKDTTNQEFLDFTKGNIGDGFSSITIFSNFNAFASGGVGDGFSKIESQNDFLNFTRGGYSDGFSVTSFDDDFNLMYKGGGADGSTVNSTQNEFNPMYRGGDADGLAYSKYGHIIYWTGEIGTGWNVSGNWANGIIPSFCNPLVIPADVPNFPAVNAGLLRIGYYKDEGDYRCQRVKIETGAEMLTRVNCFVENYDLMLIRGKLFVKNPAANAFTNLWNGTIQLKPSAEMIVKE